MPSSRYRAVVVGASLGGFHALRMLFASLHRGFPWPVIAVLHTATEDLSNMAQLYAARTPLNVSEAPERVVPQAGNVYLAPGGMHLLIESDGRFAFSTEARVNFSRPSIDVLFDSAADVYRSGLIGVVLTGANDDGARGLSAIRSRGGLAIVQNPASAEAPCMPAAALDIAGADYVLDLEQLGPLLNRLAGLEA